jgi:hypothetical protein
MNQSTLNAAKRRMTSSPPPNIAQKAAQGILGAANAFGKATYDQPSKLDKPRVQPIPVTRIAPPPPSAQVKRYGRGRAPGAGH